MREGLKQLGVVGGLLLLTYAGRFASFFVAALGAATGVLTVARMAGLLVLLLGVVPVGAQTFDDPTPLLTGQLPGCRSVSLLSEGQVGPGYRTYVTLFNPLGMTQNVEVQMFDDGSMSPPFNNWVAPPGRTSYEVLTDRAAYLTTFRAVSLSVRWEYGGVAHLTTWAVPERPLISPADWVAWIQAWRLVGYGPVTQVVICQ